MKSGRHACVLQCFHLLPAVPTVCRSPSTITTFIAGRVTCTCVLAAVCALPHTIFHCRLLADETAGVFFTFHADARVHKRGPAGFILSQVRMTGSSWAHDKGQMQASALPVINIVRCCR